MSSRLISLIRKEFIQILRDPRTLVLILIIPIMQLFLLGYAATNDVRNVPLAVFDQDRGTAARNLLESYRTADYFRLAYEVDSEEALRMLIDNGKARAGLIIPANYSEQVSGSGAAQVTFILDGSDATVASTALSAVPFTSLTFMFFILILPEINLDPPLDPLADPCNIAAVHRFNNLQIDLPAVAARFQEHVFHFSLLIHLDEYRSQPGRL